MVMAKASAIGVAAAIPFSLIGVLANAKEKAMFKMPFLKKERKNGCHFLPRDWKTVIAINDGAVVMQVRERIRVSVEA